MSEDFTPDLVPRGIRTIGYLLGIIGGAAVAPFVAAGMSVPASIAGAVSAAGNAIAFGYRPTRDHAA